MLQLNISADLNMNECFIHMRGMVAISKKGNNERGVEYVESIFFC